MGFDDATKYCDQTIFEQNVNTTAHNDNNNNNIDRAGAMSVCDYCSKCNAFEWEISPM